MDQQGEGAMTNALAAVQYKPTELDTTSLGEILVKSGFFQDTRDVAQAIVKVLAGRELGFGPIASMQGVYIVKGRVTLSANLVGATIQRSGKYSYAISELGNDRCTLVFRGPNGTKFESTFTIQDASQAGINGDTYKKFPRNMLFARALTNGARWFCPEIFNGPIYTPDELGAVVDQDGAVIENAEDGEPIDEPYDPRDAALEEWALVSAAAADLGIEHNSLPNDAPLARIERWTNALAEKVNAAVAPVA